MKLPVEVARQISQRAVAIAQRTAPRKTGKGADSLQAISTEGEIGILIPPEVDYMKYQDEGTRPRLMTELAGKTIPIRLPSGQIVFRRATNQNIGKRKLIMRNDKGQTVTTKIAWKNPGIQGTHFIEKSLQQAIQEWVSSADGQSLMRMLDDSDVEFLMSTLRGRI